MNLEWNVFIGNFNSKKIETYNIFNHGRFKDDCDRAWKKHKKNFYAFSKAVKGSLMYNFWSKCEWEVIISHWPPSERFNDKKIDVFEQVVQNWDTFITYVWNEYLLSSSRKKEIIDDYKNNRDIDTFEEITDYLVKYHHKYPELRFGQAVTNLLGEDPYYKEDNKALEEIKCYLDS